ncbi:MAG: AraC family transcriptional regulator [Hungatella sp.]|nr:AraC family transcriptional regulator [Hungatella sp.]
MDFKHEMIIPNEDLPFKLFLFEGGNGNYNRAKHWHRSVEIFLVLEGALEFFINNTSIPLEAVDFVIVNPNEIHSIKAPNPNTTIVVQIPLSCFSGYLEEEDYAVFSKQSREDNGILTELIARMYETYQDKKFGYELKVKGLFYEMLYILITRFMKAEEDQGSIRQKRNLDRLSRITSYMKKNYNQDITLEGVADEFGFSPTYLSRMFKRYADVSYKAYLLDLRTEYSFREMMNTDHSLSQVAVNNGFPNSRAFAKAFVKRYGCLPSEYRKQNGNR